MKEQSKYLAAFPLISADIAVQEELYRNLQLSALGIEEMLEQQEYAAIDSVDTSHFSKKQKSEALAVEKMAGFGIEVGTTFEVLLETLGRVPTQKEFADKATEQIHKWWSESTTVTQQWTEATELAVYNRQLRSYSSHLVELHALFALRDLFPEWNVYCSEYLDLLMGVDLVVETEKKRLYLHIFKNSKMGFLAYRKKEMRGGKKNSNGKFVRYQRNFNGHKSLQYDFRKNQHSESTQFINGNPLFKAEWLETQLLLFDKFDQFGQELADLSSFEYLEQYLQKLEE